MYINYYIIYNLIKLIDFQIYTIIVILYEFHHHLYISHIPSDDGLRGPKHVVSGVIIIFICVAVTSPFLFVSNTNRIQYYKTIMFCLLRCTAVTVSQVSLMENCLAS
jgi:hypothetical protein